MEIKSLKDLSDVNDLRLKLKLLCENFGVNLSFIAYKLCIHRSTLSNFKQGYYSLSADLENRLSQFLNDKYSI